jgi:hypothetical protein
MKKTLLFTLFIFCYNLSFSQYYQQYFDGADTSVWNSIFIQVDSSTANSWQVGQPQKTIFDSAVSTPNVLVTDTINSYPVNDSSSFTFSIPVYSFPMMIIAVQWMQKLDLDTNFDGGIIEFKSQTDSVWHNVFNNPYVYNFYGFDPANADTLSNGEYAFSGTDSSWKDIWFCLDFSSWFPSDTLQMRFTLKSDSVDNSREGWMIDNLLVHQTIIHTIKEKGQEDYMIAYPTVTKGVVHLEAQKMEQYHVIKSMELRNMEGKLVQQFGLSPTKFYIDISNHPAGIYFLTVNTNIRTETFKISLVKE